MTKLRKTIFIVTLSSIVLLFIPAVTSIWASGEIRREVVRRELCSLPQNVFRIEVSPNGRRIAYNAKDDEGWKIYVDGKEIPETFTSVGDIALFSADSRIALTAGKTSSDYIVCMNGEKIVEYAGSITGLEINPDSSSYKYEGSLAGNKHVIVNGIEFGPYEYIESFVFGPDSDSFAFIGTKENKSYLVHNGEEVVDFGRAEAFIPGYSPMGTKLAIWLYYQEPYCEMEKMAFFDTVQMENEIHGPFLRAKPRGLFSSSGLFSASYDDEVFAFCALISDEGWFVVVNGEREKVFSHGVSLPVFSDKSNSYAYLGLTKDAASVVLNGNPVAEGYQECDYLAFVPGTNELIFVAVKKEKCFVIHRDESGKVSETAGFRYYLRPDSKSYAIVDGSEKNMYLAYKGEKSNKYSMINPEDIYETGYPPGEDAHVFSPDSKHLCFVGLNISDDRRSGDFYIVYDFQERTRYDEIKHLKWSPSSLYYSAVGRTGKMMSIIVGDEAGEKPGEMYDEILTRGVVWDSPTKFHYLARDGDKIYLVEEEVVEE